MAEATARRAALGESLWPRSTDEDGFSKPTNMSGTATGIVRRVEECVIIGQKVEKIA